MPRSRRDRQHDAARPAPGLGRRRQGAGAGGLGLLLSEAVSLFQWSRLATVLLVIIALVMGFDALSRRIGEALR